MLYEMKLLEKPFKSIKSGKKTVEVRLNKEDRKNLKIGDTIEFSKEPDLIEKIKVKVLGVQKFNSFQDLYEGIPLKYFDLEGMSIKEVLKFIYSIYTEEEEKKFGALAITIQLIS